MCRQGASVIQTAVLEAIKDPSLRVYVAWVPMLPGDQSKTAQEASCLVSDQRASHFWDAGRALPTLFSGVLDLASSYPAWDVYLTYPAGITWEEGPPRPLYWQHQLGGLAVSPQLDGETLAVHVRLILASRQEEQTNG